MPIDHAKAYGYVSGTEATLDALQLQSLEYSRAQNVVMKQLITACQLMVRREMSCMDTA